MGSRSIGERLCRCSGRCVSSLARDVAEPHPAEVPQRDELGRALTDDSNISGQPMLVPIETAKAIVERSFQNKN